MRDLYNLHEPPRSMKKILITGAVGFIGMHLGLALRRRGDFVIGYDNFTPYYDVSLKKKRAQLLESAGVQTIFADLSDAATLRSIIESHQITHVLHLAAQAGVRHSLQDPFSYVDSNLSGFVHLLEILKSHPQIRLVFASSSSVYGLNKKIPFAEDDPTDHPASFYGATKKSNELMAHAYHHSFKIPMIGLRFFTVYGPWGRPDMAYFSFTKAILEGTPLTVYEGGKVQRDFTYIDDIVQGTLNAIDSSLSFAILNLGHHRPETVNTLIEILENCLKKKAIRQEQPLPPGDVPITYADLEMSQRLLQYTPTIPLEEGLSRFVDWYLEAQK